MNEKAVKETVEKAIAEEREACAKKCEEVASYPDYPTGYTPIMAAQCCANVIRARSLRNHP